jgi:signal transduction histidine kinase
VAARVNAAVDELDTTIRDIRSAIFELRSPMSAEFRAEVREMVAVAGDQLGYRPALELTGPLDSAVPIDIRADAVAVLREALSNVVRHSGAAVVRVALIVAGGQLTVTVTDDGSGVPADATLSGLRNLRERAERWGGTFRLGRNEPRGTVLEWCVPL